jgi:hypothetical protein
MTTLLVMLAFGLMVKKAPPKPLPPAPLVPPVAAPPAPPPVPPLAWLLVKLLA